MARTYQLDPVNGLPTIAGPGGQPLPLPLSAQQMRAAGAQFATPPGVEAVAPPPIPDERLAANDPAAGFRVQMRDPNQIDLAALEQRPKVVPVGAPQPAAMRSFAQRMDAPPSMAPAPQLIDMTGKPDPEAKRAPVKLAEPTEDRAPERDVNPGRSGDDAIVRRVIDESMRGSGGRGGIAVTGETRKFTMPGQVDPALAASIAIKQKELDAEQSKQAADHYAGQGQMLMAQQAELKSRQDAVEADKIKRAHVDQELARLDSVRARRQQEAASMKAPEMDDFWKDRGVGAQVGAAIAMICGGWLQGYRGGSNPGADMVNQNIDRWVSMKREEYQRSKDKVSVADNEYAQALAIYGTPAQAEADLRLRAYAVADQLIQNTAQQIGTAEAAANAQLGMKDIQLQREKATAAAQAGAKVEVEQKLARMGGGGGGTLAALEKAARAQEALDKINGSSGGAGKDARERQVRMSDGSVGWTNSAAKAKDVQDKLTTGDGIVRGMRRLKELFADGTITDRERRAKAKAIITDLGPIISQAKGQGAMAEGEVARMQDLLGDVDALLKDNGAALDTAIRQQQQRNDATVRDNVYSDPGATKFYSAPSTGPSTARDVEE